MIYMNKPRNLEKRMKSYSSAGFEFKRKTIPGFLSSAWHSLNFCAYVHKVNVLFYFPFFSLSLVLCAILDYIFKFYLQKWCQNTRIQKQHTKRERKKVNEIIYITILILIYSNSDYNIHLFISLREKVIRDNNCLKLIFLFPIVFLNYL